MDQVNPAIIPRTHRIEEAIQAAIEGDLQPFHTLQMALSTPFEDHGLGLDRAPQPEEIVPRTFCGT